MYFPTALFASFEIRVLGSANNSCMILERRSLGIVVRVSESESDSSAGFWWVDAEAVLRGAGRGGDIISSSESEDSGSPLFFALDIEGLDVDVNVDVDALPLPFDTGGCDANGSSLSSSTSISSSLSFSDSESESESESSS